MQQRFCRSVWKHEERHVTTLTTLTTIAVAVLLVLCFAVVLVSVASADIVGRDYTREGGVVTYNGTLRTAGSSDGYDTEPNQILVFKGEKIYFENKMYEHQGIKVSGPYDADGDSKNSKPSPLIKAGDPWDCTKNSNYYKVWENETPDIGGWFGVRGHSFSSELEKEEVQEDEIFTLKMEENNKMEGVMKLSIKKDDYLITNLSGKYIDEIEIWYVDETNFSRYGDDRHKGVGVSFDKNGSLLFDTTELNMKEGSYKIFLEDTATEEEEYKVITITKIYLDVELDEEEVVKGEDIVIKITSSFYGKDVNVTVGDLDPKTFLPLDEDGKIMVTISTDEVACGKHKVKVEVCSTTDDEETEKKTKYVRVKEGEASLEEISEEATVGDIISLKGTSDFGDFTAFVIEDVFKGEARISSDDEFEWDWDTEGELDGYHGIDVFILSGHAPFSDDEQVGEDWQRENGVDISASIFLLLPGFSMTVQKNIAEGDDVVISGTAKGTDHVYVIVMNHKGEVMFPYSENQNEIKATTTPVKEGEWEENIGELDSGRYTVIALYEGKDGMTDAIDDLGKRNAKWVAGDESKTLEQRMAILMDAITSAGSDDLFEKADFSVHAPKVILEEPKTVVEIGDEITVKAETNIREGAKAFVSLSQNSSIIKKNSTEVKNGSVTASIDTSGLQPGKYNVAVDISGRASAEKEVTLVEKKEVVEEGKEEIAQNESVTEPGPALEAAEEANETVGEGEFLNETGEGGEEVQKKIPVHVCDLVIAVVVASAILAVARHRRGRR